MVWDDGGDYTKFLSLMQDIRLESEKPGSVFWGIDVGKRIEGLLGDDEEVLEIIGNRTALKVVVNVLSGVRKTYDEFYKEMHGCRENSVEFFGNLLDLQLNKAVGEMSRAEQMSMMLSVPKMRNAVARAEKRILDMQKYKLSFWEKFLDVGKDK